MIRTYPMIRKGAWTALLALAIAGPASAQQLARGSGKSPSADLVRQLRERHRLGTLEAVSPVQKWLNQNIESVSWDEELFEEVINWTRELPGEMNIMVDWYALESLGVDREAPISLELRNLPLHKILNFVLEQAGGDEPLAYHGTDNILTITTEDEMAQPENFVIRVYNVIDLIRVLRSFENAPSIRLSNLQAQSSGQGSSGTNLFADDDDDDDDGSYEDRVQGVVDLIVQLIEPASWSVNAGFGTVSAHQDSIIVNNSISVHEKLGGPVRMRERRR